MNAWQQAASLVRPVGALLRSLQDAIVPQTCVVCGQWMPSGGPPACPACRGQLDDIARVSYCPRCGRTMPRVTLSDDGCRLCRHEDYWNVAGVVRVGTYEAELRQVVTGLKYAGRERNAAFIGGLLAAAIAARGWAAELDWLVPVPMHWLRRCQRRCDHADLLAAAVSRGLDVPVLRALRRIKHTPSQTRVLSRLQRFANVKGCFAVRRWSEGRLAGRCVCIIDNLLVTGATVHEVSKVFRRAGARRIYAAVIARAVLAGDIQAQPTPTV